MRRIYHHWETWECVQAGMYSESSLDFDAATAAYAAFLSDIPRFQRAMQRVIAEWPISCEQFLTNDSINRIAWLGQSAMCIETGIPRCFRAGFKLLSRHQQDSANQAAADTLRLWIQGKRTRPYQLEIEFEAEDFWLDTEVEAAWIPGRYPGRGTSTVDGREPCAVV